MRITIYFIKKFLLVIVLSVIGCSTSNNKLNNPEKWDLVYICDSSGWGVAEKYADDMERDTKKTVQLKDYAVGNLSAISVLYALSSDPEELGNNDKLRSLRSDIAEGEVIVLFANPRGEPSKGGVKGGLEQCIDCRLNIPPDSCTARMYKPYIENLKSIYEKIFSLRQGQPTIIRAVDMYNPLVSVHREFNIETECTQCVEIFNAAVRNAASAFHIPLVSVYDAFNGPGHDEDPREKGYIGDDGVHTTEKGRQTIADLLIPLLYCI